MTDESRTYPARIRSKPLKEWRCFHCDDVFASEREAGRHFGLNDGDIPACKIKGAEGGLVEALRRAERDAADAWHAIHTEATDAAKAYHAQASRHQEQLRAVEQLGYDRGIADAKAHPETLGLFRADVLEAADAMAEAAEHAREVMERNITPKPDVPDHHPYSRLKQLSAALSAYRAARGTVDDEVQL